MAQAILQDRNSNRKQHTMNTDLGSLPTVHPREALVALARNDLQNLLLNLRREHRLTSAEYAMLLGEAFGNFTASLVALERRQDKRT